MSDENQNANPTPNPAQNPTPEGGTTSGPKGSAAERINQLTRRASDAERVAAANAAESDSLKAAVRQLEAKLANISTLRPESPFAAPADRQSAGGGTAEPLSGEALSRAIRDAIASELKPLTSAVTQAEEDRKSTEKQKVSFERAAQRYPELRDANSELFQTFGQLWEGRQDLHKTDGAPELLAEVARSVLMESRGTEQVRKIAAAAHRPAGNRTVLESKGVGDLDKAQSALTDLVKTGQSRGLDDQEFEDYLRLKVATQFTPKD